MFLRELLLLKIADISTYTGELWQTTTPDSLGNHS